jgi:hypothetical protein
LNHPVSRSARIEIQRRTHRAKRFRQLGLGTMRSHQDGI